jgi:hypothetical protein
MQVSMESLTLVPPPEFLAEEATLCWRVSPGAAHPVEKPAGGGPVFEVRPNLIAQRKRVPAGKELGTLVAAIVADLVRHVEGISKVETTEFAFDDGARGFLLKYTLPGVASTKLAQLEAARLDGDVLTTLVLTLDAQNAEATMAPYLKCLASTRVNAGGAR